MTPQNILILAEGQLGDLLLLTPALRALKKGLPASKTTVLIMQRRGVVRPNARGDVLEGDTNGTAAVLMSNRAVDRVFEVDRQSLKDLKGLDRLRGESTVVKWLRQQRFDTVLCTFPEERFSWLAYLSGAKNRVGQRRQSLHWLLTVKPDILKQEQGVLSYYCGLVAALGVEVDGTQTEFTVSPDGLRWAEECIALQCGESVRPIVVHPGASGDYKIWPPDRYATLIEKLVRLDLPVILCGGEGDRRVIHEIRAAIQRSVAVVITGGDLHRLGGLFARSALVVSNDSGPRHLAVAVGARTLALFRQHHDREWNVYPETRDCRILRADGPCAACGTDTCADLIPPGEQFGSHCIRRVEVDRVLASIRELLTSS
jgi:ADP-heptose:LPS heptosyltransferase